jgi:acyl carrier protein phosphodiesterase
LTSAISTSTLLSNVLSTFASKSLTSQNPEEIIKEYRLHKVVDAKGMVYLEVTKGMYGLPQAGLLANEVLEK